jgi:hypothetical protein
MRIPRKTEPPGLSLQLEAVEGNKRGLQGALGEWGGEGLRW